MNYLKNFCLLATVPICLSASVAHAAEMETLSIKKQTSHYMDMGKQIQRVAVGNKDIASVIQLPGSASEFLIVTKANAGSTALFVWTIDGVRHEYLIVVSPEDPGQAMLIEQAIGLPDVHVKMVGERILLTGTVENQYEKNYALQTARLFINGSTESSLLVGSGFDMSLDTDSAQSASGGRSDNIELAQSESKGTIIDLLQILHPTQIRLEAQIIEINSDNVKDLGIQYGENSSSAPGIFSFGEPNDRTVTEESYTYIDEEGQTQVATYSYGSHVRPFHNNPIKWISQRFGQINATIHALVSNGKAKILSRPSVVTLSGEQATIQIGGEIPYSTTNANNFTNTSFKKYGIILQFRPVVDKQNRINSAVHAEVSNMSGQSVNGQPIIATRSADSVINLNSGMPIVIGGLMDSTESKTVSKIPLLGDIPILGEFFKHTSRTRDKRELIIVVTPYLVESEELSQAPMSEPMRQWYEQDKAQYEAREMHDFKEPEEDVLEIKEPEPERILPPANYPKDGKTTDRPFNK
ncbi:MAG: pilus assembly protein N-terminal domain-containing protein [Selenomonadaceae bacterium]|nr:pilus assembly protein N-terminal domain-containing protein [Selenomonadaceae bacterium]